MKTEAPLYTKEAKKISKMVSLPIDIFTSEWNKDLIQQVIVSLTSNQRQRTAHIKRFCQSVRGGGKKPYQTKRHRSSETRVHFDLRRWVGGGVTLNGPDNTKNLIILPTKINKKYESKQSSILQSFQKN